jgi:hypothetical protein
MAAPEDGGKGAGQKSYEERDQALGLKSEVAEMREMMTQLLQLQAQASQEAIKSKGRSTLPEKGLMILPKGNVA